MTGPAASTPRARLATVLFRLGLGWLVGRRWLLVATATPDGSAVRHSVHRFSFRDGRVVVPAGDGPWLDDLAARPVATVHAAPGPLATVVEIGEREVVFSRTGRHVPPPVVPDLSWVLPAAAVGVVLAVALGRRRPG